MHFSFPVQVQLKWHFGFFFKALASDALAKKKISLVDLFKAENKDIVVQIRVHVF